MKVLIASDIHGSAAAAEALDARIAAESPDTILLLGDLLYHGPRNPLPERYAPKEVIALLEKHADRIVAVQGNCDAEVDSWMFTFPLLNKTQGIADSDQGLILFATHGHHQGLNPNKPEELVALPHPCVFCSGHTHVKVLEQRGDILFVNPGSAGLPKDDCASYAVYEDGTVALKKLDGSVLEELTFTQDIAEN